MTRRGNRPAQESGKKRWTKAEEAQLQRDYADTATPILARRFHCRAESVRAKANSMGLKKSAEYLATPRSGRFRPGTKIGSSHWFQAGSTPWNKGMTDFAPGGRSAETQFKPGNRPFNHRPVGAQRITKDGYLQRKVSDTGYAPRDWTDEHRLMWEAQHGPVPQGHVVVFRDGNRQNLRLDNLELISRADLIRRNTIHRYPPALKKAIRQAGQLRKAIRERNHEKQD